MMKLWMCISKSQISPQKLQRLCLYDSEPQTLQLHQNHSNSLPQHQPVPQKTTVLTVPEQFLTLSILLSNLLSPRVLVTLIKLLLVLTNYTTLKLDPHHVTTTMASFSVSSTSLRTSTTLTVAMTSYVFSSFSFFLFS